MIDSQNLKKKKKQNKTKLSELERGGWLSLLCFYLAKKKKTPGLS